MIFTDIEGLAKYASVHPEFSAVCENAKKFIGTGLEKGKYPINDNVYAAVSYYDSKAPAQDGFENHRNYIDIQCIVSGTEEIHVATKDLVIAKEYVAEKDVEFYKNPESYTTVTLHAGDALVLFPTEAHRPGVMTKKGSEKISKVVFKVRV